MFEVIDAVPTGWYEENKIAYMMISENVFVYRIETADGVIQYKINIDEVYTAPIPRSFFENIYNGGEYKLFYTLEYKFLDENFKTYMVYRCGHRAYKYIPQ